MPSGAARGAPARPRLRCGRAAYARHAPEEGGRERHVARARARTAGPGAPPGPPPGRAPGGTCSAARGFRWRARPAAIHAPGHGAPGLPWEALCEPGKDFAFLGNSASLLPVRGVRSPEPWQPREVRGAVRLLAIAPLHPHSLPRLQATLHESLASGEVEWLEPLTGPRSRKAALFERLRRQPEPHIIHFIGHGGLHEGRPVLRLADEEDEESWVSVELLAQQLHGAWGQGPLRLIVLEACEGASPGALESAAELLARTAADAVLAYLWPVRMDVALRCSRVFYRALTRAAREEGDVALSLNEARRSVLAELEGSAEAFSPVLYLRGRDPVLFDFKARKVSPLPVAATRPEAPPASGPGAVPGAALLAAVGKSLGGRGARLPRSARAASGRAHPEGALRATRTANEHPGGALRATHRAGGAGLRVPGGVRPVGLHASPDASVGTAARDRGAHHPAAPALVGAGHRRAASTAHALRHPALLERGRTRRDDEARGGRRPLDAVARGPERIGYRAGRGGAPAVLRLSAGPPLQPSTAHRG
ncbi:CHAT domain-containing protein [Cystobacter fuscus]